MWTIYDELISKKQAEYDVIYDLQSITIPPGPIVIVLNEQLILLFYK